MLTAIAPGSVFKTAVLAAAIEKTLTSHKPCMTVERIYMESLKENRKC